MLSGVGALKAGQIELGQGEYKIHVRANRADGRLWADIDVLDKLYRASDASLTLPDGREIEIAVTSWTPGQDATFVVNTPL